MKLYDENTARNLLYYVAGVGTGLLCLLVPPQVEYREVRVTRVVTKEIERKVEVVKYKDRWRDRVTTTTKPDGTKIVVVDKTVEKEKTDAKETEKKDESSSTKTEEITRYMRSRYGVGVAYLPLSSSLHPDFAYRIGNLPLLLTVSPGSVGLLFPYRLNFQPQVGLRLEW